MEFRHEFKHEINDLDRRILRQRLQAVMHLDEHASGGKYCIRSIYFDNLLDKALREKIDGVNHREKFRMRYYNGSLSEIHLEKKSKENNLGNKQMCFLKIYEAQRIINGDLEWMKESGRPLVVELYSKMLSQGLQPKTIVDYVREPYIFNAGNVRVTLDYDIRTGLLSTDFLNPESLTIPVCFPGTILEVKWDAYLPEIIRDIVQLDGRRSSAFSKYAVSRMYE